MGSNPDEAELIRQAKEGIKPAFTELVNRNRDWLLRFGRRLLRHGVGAWEDEEDLVQLVSQVTWQVFRQGFLGSTPVELRAWLRQVSIKIAAGRRAAHGAAKRNIARQRPQPEDSRAPGLDELLQAGQTSPAGAADRNEKWARLAAAIATLPVPQREVIRMKHVDGLSTEDIASKLNRTANAVYLLLVRAQKRLRELTKEATAGSRP